MTARTENPSIPMWVYAVGAGAALAGIWMIGQQWGQSIAEDEVGGPIENPSGDGMAVGRERNPAESAWIATRSFVVPHMTPLERSPLPHVCDPLESSTWGPGRVCVAAGDVFISVSPSSKHHVRNPGPTDVAFSEDLQHYTVGVAWWRGVLGRWLANKPQPEPQYNTLLALQGAGWPLSLGATFVRAPYGIELLREFAETNYVKTPVGPIRIVDLPSTPAIDAFREELAARIAEALSA